MVIEPIMPIVLVQDMGPTAKLAHDATVRPEMAQAMNRVLAQEALRDEAKQIQKTEQGEQTDLVDDEGGGNAQYDSRKGKRARRPDSPDAPDPPPRPSSDPFVGKLVNKKI